MREPEMTQELQAELHQGVLVRFFGGFYVAADADGQEYTLRCPKKFRHQRLSPLVGDAVRFTPGQGEEEGLAGGNSAAQVRVHPPARGKCDAAACEHLPVA